MAVLADACGRIRSAAETAVQAESNQLPLWAPVMLGVGICGYFLLPWHGERVAAMVAMASVLLIGLTLRSHYSRILVAAGLLVLIGFGVAWLRTNAVASPRLKHAGVVQLVGIVDEVVLRTGVNQIRIFVRPFDPALPKRVRISAASKHFPATTLANLGPGARISVTARLVPPPGPVSPGGFDFARQAWFDQVGATGSALGPVSVLAPPLPPNGFDARIAAARARLTQHLKARIPGTAGSFAAAFVTGEQGGIPAGIAVAMRDAGLAHLLSISGLHIAIVVSGALWSVRKLLLLWPWLALRVPVKAIAASAAAVTGIAYTLLAGSNIPTVRACLATLIVLIGLVIGREALTLRLVATAAVLILLVRPEALLGPSFQLSFAAVTGLIALYESRIGAWFNAPRHYDGWLFRLARTALALVVTGVVAEAMLSATALYHFNRTGLYGVVANLVAIPFTSLVIMPLQILSLMADALGFGEYPYWALGRAYDLLIGWAVDVADWHGAVLRSPMMPMPAYAALVLGGLWLCLWQTRLRALSAIPIAAGLALIAFTQPADIFVSADGRQVGLRVQGDRIAQLGSRPGSFTSTNWVSATAADSSMRLANFEGARCDSDVCETTLESESGGTKLILARTDRLPPRVQFELSCRTADIVISSHVLPNWCKPRWILIDASSLERTQSVAIWLQSGTIKTVAQQIGDHPWLPDSHGDLTGRADKKWRAAPARSAAAVSGDQSL